jgi:N utilization substance protein B
MGSRRKSREDAVKLLYQWDITEQQAEEFLKAYRAGTETAVCVDAFCLELVEGTLQHRELIDKEINRWAAHWSLDRMSAVDRNILRLAVYELLYRQDIPPKVTINEAIEIAKKFSSADSASFVNGILDKVHHAQPKRGAEEVSSCG